MISRPTFRRVGFLCALLVGLFLVACQHETVQPQPKTPDRIAVDSTGGSQLPVADQPPKDVGGGN